VGESSFSGYAAFVTTHPMQRITAGRAALDGDLTVPDGATGVVLFAHGTGSSRHSPRNRMIAAALHERGLATLLVDLLTHAEEIGEAQDVRFDVGLLADRMTGLIDWLGGQPETAHLPIGLFGASTGAAAALVAAVARPDEVRAVVCRGGRPDLAGAALHQVITPTLFVVGDRDLPVLELNQHARHVLTATAELRVVVGAGHLFEEPGTLDVVAGEAGRWFSDYLR
jgi:putative phosphoribosyl transferase